MASNEDIMLALGRLQEGVDRLRADFQEEKRAAHESRSTIHRRLDEQAEDIARLKTDVAIAGKIEAQLRDEIKQLKETVEANHEEFEPSIAEWRRMKSIGIGLAGLLALGGLSFGAVLTWMGDAAVSAVRHWLRIS